MVLREMFFCIKILLIIWVTINLSMVYNLRGQVVASLVDSDQQLGFHYTVLNAADLPSGLYFVRLEASEQVFTQKVMLIR